jgi:hypothetical protein
LKKGVAKQGYRVYTFGVMENEVERYGITDVDGFAEKQRLEVARQEVHLQRAEEQLKVLRLKIAAAKRLARAEKILK